MDVLPIVKKVDGDSRFEELDQLIDRFNSQLQREGMGGTILTIETVAYEANNDWKIDAQASLSSLSSKNILILRIFYLEEQSNSDEQYIDRDNGKEGQEKSNNTKGRRIFRIGIEDFAPKQLTKATFFKRPLYETFDKVIIRGSEWLAKSSASIQFINAQSIDIKMKSCPSSSSWNTRLMAYTEHGDYMRIFRIAYLSHTASDSSSGIISESLGHYQPMILSTRLFLPMTIADSTLDIQQRLSDWFSLYLGKSLW